MTVRGGSVLASPGLVSWTELESGLGSAQESYLDLTPKNVIDSKISNRGPLHLTVSHVEKRVKVWSQVLSCPSILS